MPPWLPIDSIEFQSTLPRRERLVRAGLLGDIEQVSIHAPAQGATVNHPGTLHLNEFQSTLPRRERHTAAKDHDHDGVFQSTLPRRERLYTSASVLPTMMFQSTLPRRERLSQPQQLPQQDTVSIHAPAQGATPRPSAPSTPRTSFQSTLPRRERLERQAMFGGKYSVSIHAPAQGATHGYSRQRLYLHVSIHAPAQGATAERQPAAARLDSFNPRSRAGSDE